MKNIIEENIKENKILIFSQFTTVLKNIYQKLQNNKIRALYLDGQTKIIERKNIINKFMSDDDYKIFLLSLKAGGVGLNLTKANIVIHFDPWWNPATENQATDRAHRIGQNKTVEVIRLIAKGTIEERIIDIHEKK
ncbi:DEAD/DEAH box helicase [Spiroplasma poulsonii]|uniref:DEAD/DEAH box helicase n=1 Tax=Spiroplasma poulsonii TaxID=2138 RepID=UPI0024111817|nr:C-terminal helicase domain-containing protein [Spiroplasma poulsonii]